jgi:leucyl aminopeptidase
MLRSLLSISMLLSFSVFSSAPKKFVTVDSSFLTQKSVKTLKNQKGIALMELTEDEIQALAHTIHDEFHRCGGFMAHDTLEEAMAAYEFNPHKTWAEKGLSNLYEINQQLVAEPIVKTVEEIEIRDTIKHLSSYQNRFYKAPTGQDSQNWIKNKWQTILGSRKDARVEFFKHQSWPQPSIIATIEGSERPDEIIVLGGHADSIAGMFGGASAKAPGADDNASGIATITEAMRVLVQAGFQPKRTIKFMAYAAEEVGLLGSKEIANDFKAKNLKVVGKMQLDMTNFKGSADLDIVMMSDYTNRAQNEFLGKVIDEYVKVPWGYSKCGYACSDHASWTNAGFPASMPFEATMQEMNKDIHTSRDVIEKSGGTADHAYKFAQMATAFLIELAN